MRVGLDFFMHATIGTAGKRQIDPQAREAFRDGFDTSGQGAS
jgi:acetyl-CoA carboxylase beta subunit